MIHNIKDEEFEGKILKSDKPVVVDFWAEWCGPCKMLAPILEEVSKELGDKVDIAKMDIDSNLQTPAKYGVRGIPTLILFKNGEVVDTKVGLSPKAKLVEWINSHM